MVQQGNYIVFCRRCQSSQADAQEQFPLGLLVEIPDGIGIRPIHRHAVAVHVMGEHDLPRLVDGQHRVHGAEKVDFPGHGHLLRGKALHAPQAVIPLDFAEIRADYAGWRRHAPGHAVAAAGEAHGLDDFAPRADGIAALRRAFRSLPRFRRLIRRIRRDPIPSRLARPRRHQNEQRDHPPDGCLHKPDPEPVHAASLPPA